MFMYGNYSLVCRTRFATVPATVQPLCNLQKIELFKKNLVLFNKKEINSLVELNEGPNMVKMSARLILSCCLRAVFF